MKNLQLAEGRFLCDLDQRGHKLVCVLGYEDYQIIIPQELLEQAYRTQHTFNLVLGSIAAISFQSSST